MFYPEICDRYTSILLEVRDIESDPEEMASPHLLWMLTEIQTNPDMSETKRHRWLGYIQGIMAIRGLIVVDEERNMTRPIFKGK